MRLKYGRIYAVFERKKVAKYRISCYPLIKTMKNQDVIGFESLLDNINSIILVVERMTSKILYVNSALAELLDCAKEDCIGKTVAELRDAKDMEMRSDFFDYLMRSSSAPKDVFCLRLYKWFSMHNENLEWSGKNATAYYAQDITARKLIGEKDKKCNYAYTQASNHVDMVIWEYDKSAHTVTIIQKQEGSFASKMHIPEYVEDVPYALVDRVDEQDIDKFVDMYIQVDNGAKFVENDIIFKGSDSISARYEHVTLSSYINALGEEKIVGFCIDITNKKREEERYNRLKRQIDDVMENSYESALLDIGNNCCYDHHGVSVSVVKRHDSFTADGFLYAVGMDISDVRIQQEFFEKFSVEAFRLNYLKEVQQMSIEFPTQEGEFGMKWIRFNVQLSYNPLSCAIEAIIYMVDVTEEKKRGFIVKALASNSFHYIAFLYLDTDRVEFFSNSTDVYYLKDSSDMNIYTKLRSIRVDNFIEDEEEAARYMKMSAIDTVKEELLKANIYTFSFSQWVNGEYVRLRVYFSWIVKEMNLVLIMTMDETETYLKEQKYLKELKKALMDAELASHSKQDFISRISHDIRTPLSAITSMTNFAFEDIDDKPKLLNDLQKINSSNHFLMSLINDVLDVSKIDSGRIELVPEEYLVDEFVADVENVFSSLCEEKGVKFEIECEESDYAIIVDKVRFNQIVLNIVSNSYKYTKSGGSIKMTVKQELLDNDKIRMDLTIADTGIGMGKDFQETMFVPFTQDLGNPERQQLRTGTGLGLYIVKKLIVLMGGDIDVTSEIGKGTTMHFDIVVPYIKKENAKQKITDVKERKKLSGRVLLAEDNEINREIALRTVGGMGLDIDFAENGAIAVKRFEESEPDKYIAILMDIQMPILSGYEAAEAIRSLDRPDAKTIPIFALTANAFSEAVQQAYESGMNGHIAKPIDTEVLYRCLVEVCEKKDSC